MTEMSIFTDVNPDDVWDGPSPAVSVDDPDAPYGRNAAGKPYTMPEDKRREIGERLREGRRLAAENGGKRRPRSRGSAPRSRSTRAAAPDPRVGYALTISGLLQGLSMVLGIVGRVNPVYALDSAALTIHTPTMAEAAAELAAESARATAVLERLAKVAPGSKLLAAVAAFAAQCAVNHRVIPANEALGTLDPDALLERLTGDAGNDA